MNVPSWKAVGLRTGDVWGSAFAVCITQSSLTCQFEHSGKVRSGLIGNFYFHCYQVRPHFLCAALMSSQRTKQHAVRRLSIRTTCTCRSGVAECLSSLSVLCHLIALSDSIIILLQSWIHVVAA